MQCSRDMRTRQLHLALTSSLFAVAIAAGCSSDPSTTIGSGSHEKEGFGNNTSSSPGSSASGSSTSGNTNGGTPAAKQNQPALPDRSPVRASSPVTTARQVLTAGPFTGEQPTIRANERHTFNVTGKDCMSCHGTGGSAPHFALGGTIALGKSWVWGTPAWSTNEQSGNAYGSYDGYDSYDTSNGNSYGDLGDLGGYGTYNDGSYGGDGCDGYSGYDTGGYDPYDTGGGAGAGDGYDDGYDTGGYGLCRGGGKGWPSDRSSPSPYTGVRIVGSDGYMFDTITDADGNFWFKAKEDVKVPAFTGIRYGTFTVTGDTNGIACASCHESGKPDSPGRLWTWDGPTPRR